MCVAIALDVEKLIVGKAIQETSKEGASTAVRSYIWGKNALLIYVPPNPGLRIPSAAYVFTWKIDGTEFTAAISNSRQDWRDRDFLKGKHAFDPKIVGTDLGYFFSAAIS